jgi:hypothetical protein
MTLAPLPETFGEPRDAVHRLAVYVISPAQRLVEGAHRSLLEYAPPAGRYDFGSKRSVTREDSI